MFHENDDPFSHCPELDVSGSVGASPQGAGAEDEEESATIVHEFSQAETEDNADTDRLSVLVDKIEERRDDGHFIMIEPSDLVTEEAQAMAKHILSFVNVEEYEDLKNFIEAKLEQHVLGLPCNDDMLQKVREAMEQRDHYYLWVVQYLVKTSLHRKIFAHKMIGNTFIALLPPPSCPDTISRDEALSSAMSMTAAVLPSFDTALWNRWKASEEVVDRVNAEIDLDEEFMKFLVEHYYPTMLNTLKQFVGKIDVDLDRRLEKKCQNMVKASL